MIWVRGNEMIAAESFNKPGGRSSRPVDFERLFLSLSYSKQSMLSYKPEESQKVIKCYSYKIPIYLLTDDRFKILGMTDSTLIGL